MQLGLGTVQFGLDYGVANTTGQTPEHEVQRILRVAAAGGVSVLDTAAAYGGSEAVLGRLLESGHGFEVVTKIRPLQGKFRSGDVRTSLEGSLERLGMGHVHGLLVHHACDLLGPCGKMLFVELESLRDQGLVDLVGASIYDATEMDALLDRYDVDLVQVPLNVLDQRLLSGGQLARLAARGVQVHVRSIFLQGLLLMDPASLNPYFEPIRGHLAAWRKTLAEQGLTPAQGALAFARSLDADVVLVGVEDSAQLAANIADFAAAADLDFAPFALDDDKYVDPSKWVLTTCPSHNS
jgi:aryl-alcohol dehydrogenase-like predicted oxidoreductase